MALSMTSIGLFAGVGGFEVGFGAAGIEPVLLCEIDNRARTVLRGRFQTIIREDIRELTGLPEATILAAGFPCQDLSQAGRTNGMGGTSSGLVGEVFRLIELAGDTAPDWIVLENVPFMLRIGRGAPMRYLLERFKATGYRWAHRVVDTRAFGLPQRRRRVFVVASRSGDPRSVLLQDDDPRAYAESADDAFATGFYWTEGNSGAGWAKDSVPPLKGGSGFGIPSPPAVWRRTALKHRIVTPTIEVAERLQGFEPGWTASSGADNERRAEGARWRLVGNAVCTEAAQWVGERLQNASPWMGSGGESEIDPSGSWPDAGFVIDGGVVAVPVSDHPVARETPGISEFMSDGHRPLSARATAGFLSRLQRSRLHRPVKFERALAQHLHEMGEGHPAKRLRVTTAASTTLP